MEATFERRAGGLSICRERRKSDWRESGQNNSGVFHDQFSVGTFSTWSITIISTGPFFDTSFNPSWD